MGLHGKMPKMGLSRKCQVLWFSILVQYGPFFLGNSNGFCVHSWVNSWQPGSGWIKTCSPWTSQVFDTYCAHLGRSGYVTCLQTWSLFVHHLFLYCFDCLHSHERHQLTIAGEPESAFAFAKAALYVEERCAAQCFSHWHALYNI